MPLFKHKQTEAKEPKLGRITQFARRKILANAKWSIERACNEGRLQFVDDSVQYTDKGGVKRTYTLDELSVVFWEKFDGELAGSIGQASLVMIGISSVDIRDVILGIKDNTGVQNE